MLSKENNQLLCSVGPGTPAGEMFRSIWLPALLASQLPRPGCSPVRLKLLGEELVAFRAGNGEVGIVQARCAHRLAPLYYGKVENEGIRCAYHGWLFDGQGRCLEIPSEGGASPVCKNVGLRAYQVREKADIVWVYMGAGEPPALPKFPWIELPAEQRLASVWLQETNWLQGAEGEIDSSHVSILHKSKNQAKVGTVVHREWTFKDPKPKLYAKETAIGFNSVARRRAQDQYYWRITQWMAPMFSLIPSAVWPIGGRAWVPIDDENTYTWDFSYQLHGPLPEDFLDTVRRGLLFPPEATYQTYRLNDGSLIQTWIPKRTWRNDYLIDREQQSEPYETSGIFGVNDQDRAMQEGMGRIVDRSAEKLVASDLTVITARRRLLDIVKSPEGLAKFRALVADGTAYAQHPVDTVEPIEELDDLLEKLAA